MTGAEERSKATEAPRPSTLLPLAPGLPVRCTHHTAGECGSCPLLDVPYAEQLAAKDARVRALLADHVDAGCWLPPVASAPVGFRARAKLAVGGTAAAPSLGILDPEGRGTDLRDCGLHVPLMLPVLQRLAAFVTRAALPPYDVARRRGELKQLILTASPTGELMLRIVLRTDGPLPRVREHLPRLLEDLPALRVVSVNLHPEHKATLAGDTELLLTEQDLLPMPLGGVPLRLGPGGFFQTNPGVAAALYAGATEHLVRRGATRVADLYCGVGGFALHAAAAGLDAVGVEISADAVRAARAGADALAAERLDGAGGPVGPDGPNGTPSRPGTARFVVADASDPQAVLSAAGADRDAIVVNPPRRGLGPDLPALLDSLGPDLSPSSALRSIVYSSCNPVTLAQDLAAMPHWRVASSQLLDMFPHTEHAEVLTLLVPRSDKQGRLHA